MPPSPVCHLLLPGLKDSSHPSSLNSLLFTFGLASILLQPSQTLTAGQMSLVSPLLSEQSSNGFVTVPGPAHLEDPSLPRVETATNSCSPRPRHGPEPQPGFGKSFWKRKPNSDEGLFQPHKLGTVPIAENTQTLIVYSIKKKSQAFSCLGKAQTLNISSQDVFHHFCWQCAHSLFLGICRQICNSYHWRAENSKSSIIHQEFFLFIKERWSSSIFISGSRNDMF